MKQKFMIMKERREVDNADFMENDIIAHHSTVTKKECNIQQMLLIDDLSNKEFIEKITGIYKNYCPEYLRTKLKYLRTEAEDKIIEKYDKEFSTKINQYLSIYSEDELNKKLFDFGKYIYECINIDIKKFYTNNMKVENFYNISYKEVINKLSHLNIDKKYKLIEKINYISSTIGCPSEIIDNKSSWGIFIYSCLISYLCINKTNILNKVLEYVCLNVLNFKFLYAFYLEERYKTPKDNILVTKIYSFEYYLNKYIYENYCELNAKYYYCDYMVFDVLEDYREYLIKRTNSIDVKEKIKNYSTNDLIKSYNRKILKY